MYVQVNTFSIKKIAFFFLIMKNRTLSFFGIRKATVKRIAARSRYMCFSIHQTHLETVIDFCHTAQGK